MFAQTVTLVAALATTAIVARARPAVRFTTLTTAWIWACLACGGWIVASAAAMMTGSQHSAVGQLWYTAAVLTLCPFIAVLGARRPTVRVWNWFVLVPLAAVLLWPVALCWMPRGPSRLILETPHLVGFGLVLIMGTGNYLGTRFTETALLTAIVLVLVVQSVRVSDPSGRTPDLLRASAACLLMATTLGATARRTPTHSHATAWDGLWTDFRNTFGIVWANRIAERVNAEAAKGNWQVRLQPFGFVSIHPGQPAELTADAAKIDHTVRWLLRRFVDETWIDQRVAGERVG